MWSPPSSTSRRPARRRTPCCSRIATTTPSDRADDLRLLMTWKVTYRIDRYRPGEESRTDSFDIEIEPHRTILDGIEKVWALHDRTLAFRHACHHASCGSCAFVTNGVEVLTCIVEIQDVVEN